MNTPPELYNLKTIEPSGEVNCIVCDDWASPWEGNDRLDWYYSSIYRVHVCSACVPAKFKEWVDDAWRQGCEALA